MKFRFRPGIAIEQGLKVPNNVQFVCFQIGFGFDIAYIDEKTGKQIGHIGDDIGI